MNKQCKKKHSTFTRSFQQRAFTRKRAGGSLAFGIYTRDREASILMVASLSDTSLGKQRKEPRLCFQPTFKKEISGLYSFAGFKLKIVGGNHED